MPDEWDDNPRPLTVTDLRDAAERMLAAPVPKFRARVEYLSPLEFFVRRVVTVHGLHRRYFVRHLPDGLVEVECETCGTIMRSDDPADITECRVKPEP